MKKIIKVDGMMCEGCERRVNNALSSLEGVSSCKANAKENQVVIEFDESLVTIEDIKESIEEIGYDVVA
ncbi:heavy-metal-associated domain-containing protein [Amedibacillus sp. YH-ame10]